MGAEGVPIVQLGPSTALISLTSTGRTIPGEDPKSKFKRSTEIGPASLTSAVTLVTPGIRSWIWVTPSSPPGTDTPGELSVLDDGLAATNLSLPVLVSLTNP